MADAHTDSYQRGEMSISAQEADFRRFLGFTKWGSLLVGSLILLLTLWFCTGAGFLTAFISAAIVMTIGVTVLRDRPEPAH